MKIILSLLLVFFVTFSIGTAFGHGAGIEASPLIFTNDRQIKVTVELLPSDFYKSDQKIVKIDAYDHTNRETITNASFKVEIFNDNQLMLDEWFYAKDGNLILEVENITKEVNSPEGLLTIVKDINLSVEQGKPISLVGPSGSGKTTLLAIMAGLDLPTRGTVTLLGSEITGLDEDKRAQIRGKDVGFVFQSFHLMPRLSALDNVMLPLEISGDPNAMGKAQEALGQVGLAKRSKHFATQLSGGEKQRVAIARAIVNKPKILFADEPTGNLDKKSSGAITDLLFSINELINTTLVLVTHDLVLAEKCDEVFELSDGCLL